MQAAGPPPGARASAVPLLEIGHETEALGIIMENERTERSQIHEYVHSIDDIEARANLDFFHELDDADAFEASGTPDGAWRIRWELRPGQTSRRPTRHRPRWSDSRGYREFVGHEYQQWRNS